MRFKLRLQVLWAGLCGLGRGGTGTFKVDVSTQRMERTVPLILPWDETFNIGADTGTPVDDRPSATIMPREIRAFPIAESAKP
jgi:hypothetical protein